MPPTHSSRRSSSHQKCTTSATARLRERQHAHTTRIPGRALNFPTTIPSAASSSHHRGEASADPAESDILAVIAACHRRVLSSTLESSWTERAHEVRTQLESRSIASARKRKRVVRAHDIWSQAQLPNWRQQRSGFCWELSNGCTRVTRSLPAFGAGQPSQPPRVAPGPGSSACARKGKQPLTSSIGSDETRLCARRRRQSGVPL
jgi:hypothetical protein